MMSSKTDLMPANITQDQQVCTKKNYANNLGITKLLHQFGLIVIPKFIINMMGIKDKIIKGFLYPTIQKSMANQTSI